MSGEPTNVVEEIKRWREERGNERIRKRTKRRVKTKEAKGRKGRKEEGERKTRWWQEGRPPHLDALQRA